MVDEILIEEEFARTRLTRATAGRLLGFMKPYRKILLKNLALETLWVSSMLLDM